MAWSVGNRAKAFFRKRQDEEATETTQVTGEPKASELSGPGASRGRRRSG